MSPTGREDERRDTPRGDRAKPAADRHVEGEERSGRDGRRRGLSFPSGGLVLPVVGLLVLALVAVGGLLLWRWYGDQTGGTSPFEDSVASGPEPLVRLTNGPGQVRVEGAQGAEAVEITAERYARGSDSAAARENASRVAVDVVREGSTLEISSDGGRGTGVDYALRVPEGSRVEVESAAGDVEVSGVADAVRAKAEMGDVTVREVRGSVTVEAPRGDVTVEGVSTETGDVELSVGSGDLVLRDLLVGLLEARVEAGGAELLGRFAGGGRLLVETGSIAVRVPPEDVRELSLEARVGEVAREGDAEGGE